MGLRGTSKALALTLVSACNSIVGIEPPVDRNPDASAPPDANTPAADAAGSDVSDPDRSAPDDASKSDGFTTSDTAQPSIDARDGTTADPDAPLEGGGRLDRWVPIPTTTDSPGDRMYHSAVWTGKEMIVWGGRYVMSPEMQTGGRYNPVTQKWVPTSLVQAPAARASHSAVWTDAEMIIWGGATSDGGRYDPEFDRWRPMMTSRVQGGRAGHAAVWTGSEMLVWCGVAPGSSPLGEKYSPSRDEWTDMSDVGAPPCTVSGTAVWTGSKWIVWGGQVSVDGGTSVTNAGGIYDYASNKWRLTTTNGAPAPRKLHSAVWTGSVMIVWGGERPEGDGVRVFDDGAAYDPVLDRWDPIAAMGALGTTRHVAAWSPPTANRQGLMLVWGGAIESGDAGGVHILGEGRVYDPIARSWYPMSMTGEPWPRVDPTVVWTGTEMIVWGGFRSIAENGSTGRDGGRYTP
jgi:hypothetical protein